MDSDKISAMEEELKRDLEALARVKRIMKERAHEPSNGASPIPISEPETMADDDDGPVTSLRAKIEEVINADPDVKWTTQKVLSYLEKIKFPLNAKKPIYSVGQALSKNVDQGTIVLFRKGAGSKPNIYKGAPKQTVADFAPWAGDRKESDSKLN